MIKLRHSRPLASDLPTEAFNGCCLERLVRSLVHLTETFPLVTVKGKTLDFESPSVHHT